MVTKSGNGITLFYKVRMVGEKKVQKRGATSGDVNNLGQTKVLGHFKETFIDFFLILVIYNVLV